MLVRTWVMTVCRCDGAVPSAHLWVGVTISTHLIKAAPLTCVESDCLSIYSALHTLTASLACKTLQRYFLSLNCQPLLTPGNYLSLVCVDSHSRLPHGRLPQPSVPDQSSALLFSACLTLWLCSSPSLLQAAFSLYHLCLCVCSNVTGSSTSPVQPEEQVTSLVWLIFQLMADFQQTPGGAPDAPGLLKLGLL